jgi:hypothetical protein
LRPNVRISAEPSHSLKVARFVVCPRRVQSELSQLGKDGDAHTINELIAYLGAGEGASAAPAAAEGDHPVHAVAAAYITALTRVSVDEDTAAQLLARKLVAHGYPLPRRGGDARGWKRLLMWRDQLARGRLAEPLYAVYEDTLKFAARKPADVDLSGALVHAGFHTGIAHGGADEARAGAKL